MKEEAVRALLRRPPFDPLAPRLTNGEKHEIRNAGVRLLAGVAAGDWDSRRPSDGPLSFAASCRRGNAAIRLKQA